jgi:hypothetical protein
MDSVTMMESTSSIPMKQMICHLASKQSPIRMREPRKTHPVASMPRAEKMKAPVSKVWVGLVPLPNAKNVTAKSDTRSNMRHKPGGDCEDTYEEPQA